MAILWSSGKDWEADYLDFMKATSLEFEIEYNPDKRTRLVKCRICGAVLVRNDLWQKDLKVCRACKTPYCAACEAHFDSCWKGWFINAGRDCGGRR